MFILKNKKIFLALSAFFVFLSFLSVFIFGFNFSIDFKGGVVYEIKYTDQKNIPTLEEVKNIVKKTEIKNPIIQKKGEESFVIKSLKIEEKNKEILNVGLSFNNTKVFEEIRLKNVGPSVSSELKNKSIFAIFLVSFAIILFISFVFRKVSKPVSSSKYGFVAILALIHDIIIPTGFFAFLGFYSTAYQIDVLFVTALLAILGFSVNDTIIIFDRIRENLKNFLETKKEKEKYIFKKGEFETIVEISLKQSFRRSLFTSITTFLVLASLFIFGGETTKPFALTLALGTIFGTYSSIFLASPLLVLIESKQKVKNLKKEDKEKIEKDKNGIVLREYLD